MWLLPKDGLIDVAENLGKPPEGTAIQRWVGGVALALVPVAWGVWRLIRGESLLIGKGGWTTLDGWAGVGLSLAWIGLGGLIHVHYFWTTHPKLALYAELGKVIFLLALAGGIVLAVVMSFADFFRIV